MNFQTKIILVEDDTDLGNALKQYLEISGFEVLLFANPADLLNDFEVLNSADLAILDVMLPEIDGFSLAKKIAEKHSLPFIFLTAKGQSIDRISGLKIGAEDYISKPCEPEELLLRIKNILKRNEFKIQKEIEIGNSVFHPSELTLQSKNQIFTLTEKEKDLLLLLFENKNKLVSRKEILEKLWGENDYFLGRSLDVFMTRIRKYFAEDGNVKFETVRGVGIRIVVFE